MFVRTAGEQDVAAASKLIGEVLHVSHDAFYGSAMVDLIATKFHSAAALKAAMHLPRSEFLVADDGEQIAGVAFAAAQGDDARVVSLIGLHVATAMEGRGIGGMLLQEIEVSFFESERLRLEVDERNLRAIGFFEGEGYQKSGQRRDETLQATIVMLEKSLV